MMFNPWGPSAVPTGGAGVAWPAWIWIFTTAASFFLAISLGSSSELPAPLGCHARLTPDGHGRPHSCGLELGDLTELELHGGLAAEDVDEHLEPRPVEVNLADDARELGERPRGHPDLLGDLVLEARARLLLRCALGLHAQDVLDLAPRQGGRLRATSDEAGDARGVAHDIPRVVIQSHASEQVPGEDLLLHDDLAAVLELDDVFHRNDDLEDPLFDVHRPHAAGEVLFDLVLVARVGVHDVPVAGPVVRSRLRLLVLVLVVG